MCYQASLVDGYSPLYYIAALGHGGLAVSFFMHLIFMVPYLDTPIPSFAISKRRWCPANRPGHVQAQRQTA